MFTVFLSLILIRVFVICIKQYIIWIVSVLVSKYHFLHSNFLVYVCIYIYILYIYIKYVGNSFICMHAYTVCIKICALYFFYYRYEYRSHQIWFPVRVLGDWCLVFITHMHTCTHCTWWLTGACWEEEATTLDTVPSHATWNTEQYIVLGTTLLVWKGIIFYWLRWSLLENIPTASLPCYEMEICHTMVFFAECFTPGWCVVWLFRLVVSLSDTVNPRESWYLFCFEVDSIP